MKTFAAETPCASDKCVCVYTYINVYIYTCVCTYTISGSSPLPNMSSTVKPLYNYKTLNKEHLSSEDIVCSPNHIKLCTNLPLD